MTWGDGLIAFLLALVFLRLGGVLNYLADIRDELKKGR